MKQTAITKRDEKMKLFIELLQNMTWNLPTDFSISIRTFEFYCDNEVSAYGYISIYPNNGIYILDSALEDILHITNALSLAMTIRAKNSSPIVKVSFHEYSK